MTKSICLDFQTTSGVRAVWYDLVDSDIALRWYDKIKYLQQQGMGIDHDLTSDVFHQYRPYQYYKQQLDAVIDWVNTNTDHVIEKKQHYGNPELCVMHDVYVMLTQTSNMITGPEIYQLNKLIHLCEATLADPGRPFCFDVSWGMNDGVTREDFQQDPYEFYTLNIRRGSLYLYWTEIGKRPREYWRDGDPRDLENFLRTVTPHRSWSSFFKINLGGCYRIPTEFWQWFESYRKPFLDKWNLDDWTDLHENGAIELAHPREPYYYFDLKNKFVSLVGVRTSD